MRRYNLTFTGEIVSSPGDKSSWAGTTVSFWGKFNEGPEARHFNSALLNVPDEYLYEGDGE
jgi:hypothetical protein